MPEHFTRNTVEASFWCSKCHKATMHRVDDVRRGPCLACLAKWEAAPKSQPAAVVEQGQLFG